jgi:superfamily II DNA/RNA helicase
MIKNNYLVGLKSYQLVKIYNLDKVRVTGGDYNLSELSKIVSNNQTILEIVNTTFDYIHKYKKAIVFAVDINHSELLTKAYQHEGFTAKALHSKMTTEEINKEIELFKNNETKILVSVLMLTTGFDVPDADVAVIARPTKSQNLYKQMIGRVLRLAEGKTHAILLDCGNVIENLGMPLDPIKERAIEETENVNRCKKCKSENLKLQKKNGVLRWVCNDCGFHRDVKEGAYQCKICKKTYTHDAKFDIKNNKFYLICDDCPYPSLISEFTGDEKFVKVEDKTKKYLPFDEARRYVRALKLSSPSDWVKFIKKVDIKNNKLLPDNIPTSPSNIYKNEGWKDIYDWLGIVKEADLNVKTKWDDKKEQKIEKVKTETNSKNDQYLPFGEAREFVRSLNLKSRDEWKSYIKNVKEGKENIPQNIPMNPHIVYQNSGWININDWIKSKQESEHKETTSSNMKYLPFEEAKVFMYSLKLTSIEDWIKYKKGELEGYDPKPENIPEKPQKIYKNKGWKDFENWIGLDKIKQEYFEKLTEYIDDQNIEKLYDCFKQNSYLDKNSSIEYIVKTLDNNIFLEFISKFNRYEKIDFMNSALSVEDFNKFIFLAKGTYESKSTWEFNKDFERVELEKPKFNTFKLLSHIDKNILCNVLESNNESSIKILDFILDDLQDIPDYIKIGIFFVLVELNQYDKGLKIIESGITLNDICFEIIDFSSFDINIEIDKVKSILEIYPNQWSSLDIAYQFYVFESFLSSFDELSNFIKFLLFLNKKNINIYFNSSYTSLDFIDYINKMFLTENYQQDDNGNINIVELDKFIKQFISFLISKKEINENDFYDAIFYDFDIEIVKMLYKEEFNKETFETERFQKFSSLIDIAKRRDNIQLIDFLKEKNLV